MCDLDDESEFEISDSEYDNTASASDSEISADEVISNGVSKGENGDFNTVENDKDVDDKDEDENEKLKNYCPTICCCIYKKGQEKFVEDCEGF